MSLPRVALSAKRNSLHPWIFLRMVRRPSRRIAPGTLVEVESREGEFIGRGIYNGTSQIAVRLLTEERNERLDSDFFRHRLAEALRHRVEDLDLPSVTDSFRWVHGEADGLSGLIIDRFGDVVVIEPFSAGYRGEVLEWIVQAARDLVPGARIAVRPDERSTQREGYDFVAERRRHPGPESATAREHGLDMEMDLRHGHKTGFFLDQRENRHEVARLAKGRRVLDLFCYTGGFAISAARGGASHVAAADLDEKALAVARRNVARNEVHVELEHADAFDVLRRKKESGDAPDLLVLDPPKYALVKEEISRAYRMYGDLNRLGMELLSRGGLLVTCSCSGLVSEPDFLSVLTRAAAQARVELRIFRVTGAAPDHPFSTRFPEARYLKAVFARVVPLGQESG
jgi:23S rRNA (cytosine1962-C5)-methyltransferase